MIPAAVEMRKRSMPSKHWKTHRIVGVAVGLIGKGLISFSEPSPQAILSEAIDQQTQHHDEDQGYNPLRLRDRD
jgi:hypothetical protein